VRKGAFLSQGGGGNSFGRFLGNKKEGVKALGGHFSLKGKKVEGCRRNVITGGEKYFMTLGTKASSRGGLFSLKLHLTTKKGET